jgi:hypothetical protein
MVVVVPIGFRCMTSMALRHFGFQQQSLPFDWLGASLPSITAALADDLRAMLRPEDIASLLDIGPLAEQNRTVHNKYGMACTHVFKKQLTGREQEAEVLATAQRRAERLLTILRGAEPVLFVRHQNVGCPAPTYEEWQAFVTTVHTKFPTLRFRILYIQVGKKTLHVPPEVKLLVGDYPINPVGGKFEAPEAQCSEVIKQLVTNLCHKLEIQK